MSTKTYDPKCRTLAAQFLNDHLELFDLDHVVRLAGHIQESIEDWISAETAAIPVKLTADSAITPELGARLTQIAIDTEPEEQEPERWDGQS